MATPPLLQRPLRALAGLALLVLAAACETLPGGIGGDGPPVARGEPVPVALLVPGPGGRAGDAAISQSLENAARLAAADLQGAGVDLRVYTTSGRPDGAQAAASRAVQEGAAVIVGPLYAASANAAGLVAAPSGVNVLAFSNNPAVAGGNVFLLGSTFDNAAARVMGYAARQGRDDVLVVAGSNPAEQAGRAAIERAAGGSGARVVGVAEYEFSQPGVTAAAPRVADAVQSGGADAVFLTADAAGALPLLAELLPAAGVSAPQTQYLGLARWDIPPSTLSLPGVQGAWFALPDPERTARFEARYRQAYGAAPHPLAGLAFDGVAAVGAIAAEGRGGLGARSLTRRQGFAGTGGAFRLRADGTSERALAVAEVRDGRAVIVDPAPGGFGGLGS